MIETQPKPQIDAFYEFKADKTLEAESVPDEVEALLHDYDSQYQLDRSKHFQRIIDSVKERPNQYSPPYTIFRDEDSSAETALVVPLPYCNPIVPDNPHADFVTWALEKGDVKAFDSNTWNNGEKHLFLFESMKALGIQDAKGHNLPVIAISSDSADYRPKLKRQARKELRAGSLEVYVRNVQDILDKENFGRAHIAGYSQGASVAHAVAANAKNIDIESLVLAELPTYKQRSIGQLATNYLLNKPGVKDSEEASQIKWTADGPLSRQELEGIQNKSGITMLKTIVKGAWRTALALRHETLTADLEKAITARTMFPLTVAWNETSALTHDIETELFGKDTRAKCLLETFRHRNLLRTVKALGHQAVGAPHLAGESPLFYSLMIAESVAWAQGQLAERLTAPSAYSI